MKLCPVDLLACDRPACRSGHCQQAASRRLTVCWECGALDEHGAAHGVCIACVSVTVGSSEVPEER